MTDLSNCEICGVGEPKYSCPRCNISYCSVSCYQSEKHAQCSEVFYEKWVQQELKECGSSEEAKKKMIEILKQQQFEGNESEDESLDSDDDEVTSDLASRMSNINLDDEEAVWNNLTTEEKQEFKKLIASGNILNILPNWEPWWKTKKRKTLVQDCDESEFDVDILCPVVPKEIPLLTQLTKSEPSPNIVYMVVNVLSSYTFSVRWFKGNHDNMPIEAITTINALSATLRSNEVFTNVIEAFSTFEEDMTKCKWITSSDYDKNLIQEDLLDIVKGSNANDAYFCVKAALSDINKLCLEAVKILKQNNMNHLKRFSGEPPKVSHINMISKKMSYYLSWTLDHGMLLQNVLRIFS